MDQSWMNANHMSPAFEEGVEQLLEFSFERSWSNEDGKSLCLCINCLNERLQVLDDIREHFMCDGIKKNNTIWIWHGEFTDMQRVPNWTDWCRNERLFRGYDLWSWTRVFQQVHAPMYDTLESELKKPLYSRCKKSLTLLLVVLSLVNVKAKYGWSEKNFPSLLNVVQDMLPEENTLSKSY